jgi:copper chaperone CopZ
MYTKKFKITDLTCEACVKLSLGALKEINGVISAEVDLKTGFSQVESNKEISFEEILKALDSVEKHAEEISNSNVI